jgi:methionine-gamma-lyase
VTKRGIGTRAVHGSGAPRRGPLVPPIAQTSTFVFASSDEMRRYLAGDRELFLYTRYANPTIQPLERTLAALEEAEDALALASGMAAMTTAVLSIVRAGDEVVGAASLYGGTTRLLRHMLPRLGIATRIVPDEALSDLSGVASPATRVLILESPTNPCLAIVDIEKAARAAHALGIVIIVDNTFATPVLQRPLALGADLVMHSLTKSLSGHSDLIGGALAGPSERIASARETMKILGGCMDPHAAFLAQRGLRTLHLRVARQCENALALARHLDGRAKIARVLYPGLVRHPGHEVAKRQMAGFGGMLSLVLEGGLPAAERFYDGLGLMARAASLGGVETLVSLPVHTSHSGFTPEELAAAGVDPGTVRISLGVEDAADLIEDADAALARV